LQLEIERCQRELAEIERLLMAGHPDVPGLCLALSDWSAELRILQNEQRRQAVKPGGAREAGSGVELRGNAVGALLGLGAEGLDLQPELLGEHAADESAHGVRLPAGGLHDFGERRALLAPQ
jgi:hypothetical protein